MPRMLADAKDTLILLDEWPADPRNATVADLQGTNASYVVGKSGFNLGAGAPNSESDTPLGTEGDMTLPVSKTYEATMNVYRYFDPDTGQIDAEEDFFFQALKEFGSEVPVAYREGGKDPEQPPAEGDEWSFYKLMSGGMGRSTERTGYTKRVANVTIIDAVEDVTITGAGSEG